MLLNPWAAGTLHDARPTLIDSDLEYQLNAEISIENQLFSDIDDGK